MDMAHEATNIHENIDVDEVLTELTVCIMALLLKGERKFSIYWSPPNGLKIFRY